MTIRAIVAVFGNQNAAYDAADAIKKLSKTKDDFKVRAGAMVAKDANGNARLLDEKDRPLWGTLAGGVIGALFGAIAGPAALAAGAIVGGTTGLAAIDATSSLIDSDEVAAATQDLKPGMTGLLLEVEEGNTVALDAIVIEHGGLIRRINV